MAESPEHQFITSCFTEIVAEFSRLDLYTYANVDRQLFDFACTIKQSLSRTVVGQTLWKNRGGIEKDLRSLLLDDTAEIKVYVVPAEMATLRLVDETRAAFARSGLFDQRPFRLLSMDVPVFDADRDAHRETVRRRLRDQITDDLLFRVVFGGLTARDVGYLLHVSNFHDAAFNLRLLHYIRTEEHYSYRATAAALGVSPNKVRERRHVLFGAGLIRPERHRLVVTDSGETFARLLDRLAAETRAGAVTPELVYLFDKIGCPLGDMLLMPSASSEDSFRPAHVLGVALTMAPELPDVWRADLNPLIEHLLATRPDLHEHAEKFGIL